ncbi:DUF6630 family protein [Alloscardovia theropitheci]|nr:DUF6630 family protein [Alloscardovia theropitheci]
MGLLSFLSKKYRGCTLTIDDLSTEDFTWFDIRQCLRDIDKGRITSFSVKTERPLDTDEYYRVCSDMTIKLDNKLSEYNPSLTHYICVVEVADEGTGKHSLGVSIDGLELEETAEMVQDFLNNSRTDYARMPLIEDWDIEWDNRPRIQTEIFKRIASMLTYDQRVLARLHGCFANPRKYFLQHKDSLSDSDVYETSTENTIAWYALVDELSEVDEVGIFSEDDALDDFIDTAKSMINRRASTDARSIELHSETFDSSQEMSDWAIELDRQLQSQGYRLVNMDVMADYVVFLIYPTEKLSELIDAGNELAEDSMQFFEFETVESFVEGMREEE